MPFSIIVEVFTLRRTLQASCLSIAFIFLLAAIAPPLWAHAVLMQSKPQVHSTVKGPDIPIWLRFNSRVDGGRSRVHLLAADGSPIPTEALKQTSPDTLETRAAGLKPGTYKLQWQVLASDGHISSGEVAFTVN
ncbi:MAG: copper resistance CopC family protein [Candidatus Korobacteraceae bacterium]